MVRIVETLRQSPSINPDRKATERSSIVVYYSQKYFPQTDDIKQWRGRNKNTGGGSVSKLRSFSACKDRLETGGSTYLA
ncbi:hypothetical protein WN55_10311 [Dufourea novaeangliae]|uniref:Uncharacterized protein n=1 Tax=Dufourea novaeangliae TaxID=178035 RepID=A0A154P3F5_DUFNO|nr:hypothetical protein WN55_10311 [Dufourea novaeangliae]